MNGIPSTRAVAAALTLGGFPTLRVAGVVTERHGRRDLTVRQNTSSNNVPSDLELELQRRGNARALSVEDRETAAAGLEVLGYTDTARRLRDLNRCLQAPTLRAVPQDGRTKLASTSNRPILVALDGSSLAGTELSADDAWWDGAQRLCERHRRDDLSPLAASTLDALRRTLPPQA